jgi:hypothetical protein
VLGARSRLRRLAILLVGALAVAFAIAGVALGDGSPTIAGASPVPLGSTLIGNTSSDPVSTVIVPFGSGAGCTGAGEFWTVKLLAGDEVTIAGASLSPAAGMYVDLFPAGTSDADVAGAKPLLSEPLVTATTDITASGTYPVLIGQSAACGGADGPFHFAITVVHKAVVALPAARKLGQTGTLTAKVMTTDKQPINDFHLHLSLYAIYPGSKKQHLLGTATASAGTAVFSYKLPASTAGKSVTIEVKASGADYQPIAPATGTFKVH